MKSPASSCFLTPFGTVLTEIVFLSAALAKTSTLEKIVGAVVTVRWSLDLPHLSGTKHFYVVVSLEKSNQ